MYCQQKATRRSQRLSFESRDRQIINYRKKKCVENWHKHIKWHMKNPPRGKLSRSLSAFVVRHNKKSLEIPISSLRQQPNAHLVFVVGGGTFSIHNNYLTVVYASKHIYDVCI